MNEEDNEQIKLRKIFDLAYEEERSIFEFLFEKEVNMNVNEENIKNYSKVETPISISQWQKVVYELAASKGFHTEGTDNKSREMIAVFIMNIISEASELWESFRVGQMDKPCDKAEKMSEMGLKGLMCAEEELADIVIRAMDTAESLGINLEEAIKVKHAYNSTRAFRHGNKLA